MQADKVFAGDGETHLGLEACHMFHKSHYLFKQPRQSYHGLKTHIQLPVLTHFTKLQNYGFQRGIYN